MRKIILLFLLAINFACDKNDDNETSQILPEATQTGRGIFACLVDGKPFIDKSGNPNGISFNCFYQLVDGEYYFGITGEDTVGMVTSISIGTNKNQILEGLTYQLYEPMDGNTYGVAGITESVSSGSNSYTSPQFTGTITITKFDLDNQIVSGTFWFDIGNPYTGERVEIREGRFDTHFGL